MKTFRGFLLGLVIACTLGAISVVMLAPRVYWTLADMDATAPSKSAPIAIVVCRTNAGDWGGPKIFWYEPTDTNQISEVCRQPGGGVLGRMTHDWDGDVRVFGAIEGTNDNTTVFAQACAEAKRRNGGFTIYIPPGSWRGTWDLPYRVNIKGANAGRFSEFSALAATNVTFAAGLSQLVLPTGANRPLIIITNDGSGYVRQPGKIWADGSVYDSVYAANAISDVILNGNGGNQTLNNCDLVRATGVWGLTIENVGFFNNRGYAVRGNAWNACRMSKIFGFAATGPTPSKGFYFGTAADCQFSEWWVGGYDGPVFWIRGSDYWKNQHSDMMLFNSGSAGSFTNRWTISVNAATDVVTATNHLFETGDPVEFYTVSGTLPTGVVSTNTYHVIKVDGSSFKVSRSYIHALGGTNTVDFTDAGSGTFYAWCGPMVGFYASDQARRNTFANIRVDQNYTDGFVLNNAHRNVFSSLFAGENDFLNSANDSYGVRIKGNSQGNAISGIVIYTTPGGVSIENDSSENTIAAAAIDTDVTTRWNVADENDKNFYQEARSLLIGEYARVGNSNQTTALEVVGNASGVRSIKMSRPSSGVTNSFGLTTDGFIFNNDTLGSRIAALLGSAVYGELSFSRAGSDHNGRQSVIRGGAAVGTDKDGASFDIIGSAGTGGATGGGAINFKTPNAGASGTTTQTETTKLSVQRQGNLILTELSSAPTLNAPNGSIFYGVIGGVTNFWFYRTNGWVGLP